MDDVPRIALAMPIGAWHPLLEAALRSVAIQNVALELAILDGSGDSRVSDAIARSGVRPHYHRRGEDRGQSAAIAEGWRETAAPFVGWLNCDDILLPGALATILRCFEAAPQLDAVYGGSTIIDKAGSTIGIHAQVREMDDQSYRSNPISQPSCIVRRSAIAAVGGLDENLHFTMDWDLWVRLYRSGARFRHIGEWLSAVYWGEGTKTAMMSPARLGEIARLSRMHAGRLAAFKTVVGVLLQHRPRATRLLYRLRTGSRTAPPEPAERGLRCAADRNPTELPRETLSLPVVNTHSQSRAALVVEFDSAGGCVSETGRYRARRLTPHVWEVRSNEIVRPGHALTLDLACPDGFSQFLAARWIDQPPATFLSSAITSDATRARSSNI